LVEIGQNITGPEPLEARSGHKTLLKLLLENQGDIIQHIDDNSLQIKSIETAVYHLIEQNKIIIRHHEDVTGEAYHPTDLTD